MTLLDSILNAAVLLLWLNWRSIRLEPATNAAPRTLAGTLKSTQSGRLKGWPPLISMCLLILLRVVVAREIGAPVDWTPKLNLGFVVLAFRSDTLSTATLYTVLGTLRLTVIFYFWVLCLLAVNRGNTNPDPMEKLLRLQVGRPARWSRTVQVCLPLMATVILWLGIQPLLVRCGVAMRADSFSHLIAQGLIIALGLVLSLKYLLPAILLSYVLLSYVYLGNNPAWDFISATARNLLAPLQPMPLRFAKVDLAPFGGLLLVLFLLHWVPNLVVAGLARRNLTLWPH